MVNMSRIEKILTPAVGRQRASLLASLAGGVADTIAQNPLAAALLPNQMFPAFAVIYGLSQQQAHEALAQARTHNDLENAETIQTAIDEMEIVRATLALAPPNDTGMSSLQAILEQLGVNPADVDITIGEHGVSLGAVDGEIVNGDQSNG